MYQIIIVVIEYVNFCAKSNQGYVHRALYDIQCISYIIHYTMYAVHCSLLSARYSVHTAHCIF